MESKPTRRKLTAASATMTHGPKANGINNGLHLKRCGSCPRWPISSLYGGGNYFADCLPASGGWLIWRKPEAETGFSLADAELCWTSRNFAARMKTMPRRDGNDHPTQKPVLAMAWTMDQLKVPAGATVFDPYMGSGTTGIACLRTGRNFIGVERDPRHYATALRRIRSELEGALL